MYARSLQSCLALCGPMDYSRQAPLSMGFSRQEYWRGLPCPSPGDLPNPEVESVSLKSPALVGGFFTTSTTWEPSGKAHSTPNFLNKLSTLDEGRGFPRILGHLKRT